VWQLLGQDGYSSVLIMCLVDISLFVAIGVTRCLPLGVYAVRGRKRIGLAARFVPSAVMAPGSPSDATILFVFASLLPVAGLVICAMLFRASRPVDGLTGMFDELVGLGAFISCIAHSLTKVPSI
jgi:hypothetical protein